MKPNILYQWKSRIGLTLEFLGRKEFHWLFIVNKVLQDFSIAFDLYLHSILFFLLIQCLTNYIFSLLFFHDSQQTYEEYKFYLDLPCLYIERANIKLLEDVRMKGNPRMKGSQRDLILEN